MKKAIILYTVLLVASSCQEKNDWFDATGIFEATEIIVSAEGNGKLLYFDADEGNVVSKGDRLGCIDTLQLHYNKMATLEKASSTVAQVADIKIQIASIQEQIDKQLFEKQRFSRLLTLNAANRKQVEDIDSQIEILRKQLSAQQSTLEKANTSLNRQSQAMLIQVDQIEDQLEKCKIQAPITGTILNKYAEPGELASIGKPLFKIADVTQLYLRAYVTNDQLSQIDLGDQVKVYADFGEQQNSYDGVVTWISDKAEFTPKGILTKNERANLVYAVKVAVLNDGKIKIGMYGEVKFHQ